jgi:hypothetical protein
MLNLLDFVVVNENLTNLVLAAMYLVGVKEADVQGGTQLQVQWSKVVELIPNLVKKIETVRQDLLIYSLYIFVSTRSLTFNMSTFSHSTSQRYRITPPQINLAAKRTKLTEEQKFPAIEALKPSEFEPEAILEAGGLGLQVLDHW